jgi:hypothetical protein
MTDTHAKSSIEEDFCLGRAQQFRDQVELGIGKTHVQ